uniref:POU domain protein n=1 Tax=Pelodiscus sinensis TaxID=13735 RepID=K7FRK3_PELSI
GDVGLAMGKLYGNDFSQTTISRFEALNLSFKNMCKLKPLLEKWLNDAGRTQSFPGEKMKKKCRSLSVRSRLPRTGLPSSTGPYRPPEWDWPLCLAARLLIPQNQKPTSEEILLIAEQLNMEKEVIRVWFCNRRQKEKRINPCSSSPMLPTQGKPPGYGPHMVPSPGPGVNLPLSQASSSLSTTGSRLKGMFEGLCLRRTYRNSASSDYLVLGGRPPGALNSATPPPSNSTNPSPQSSTHPAISLSGLNPNTG